ncbi:hypothetical protein QYB48_002782 [Clostridium perfringens]|nr:hypothetical protein [Clostridium perfringens]
MMINKRLLKIEKILKKKNKGKLFPSFIIKTSDGIFKAKEKVLFLCGDTDFEKIESIENTNLQIYDFSNCKIKDLFFLNRIDKPYPIIHEGDIND